ncbi:MAG: hypothetical protein WDO19_15510 [Bacteroidota bacterium]
MLRAFIERRRRFFDKANSHAKNEHWISLVKRSIFSGIFQAFYIISSLPYFSCGEELGLEW